MPATLLRVLLLVLSFSAGAVALLCFVLACAAALRGAFWPTVGWLGGSVLGALGVVGIPALGSAALWAPPSSPRRPPPPPDAP